MIVGSEVRSRVVGIPTQMQSFDFFFGIQLGVLVLRYADNLSSTLQCSRMLCYEAQ